MVSSMNPKNPKSAAAGVLRSCWPNGEVPVDPVAVAQKLGVDVRVGDLPPSYSGAIIKEPGSDPVILLAWEDHPNPVSYTHLTLPTIYSV